MANRLTFSEFVNLTEDAGPDFPAAIYLKRQAIRQYPSGSVALYKDFSTGLLIAIPQQWLKK